MNSVHRMRVAHTVWYLTTLTDKSNRTMSLSWRTGSPMLSFRSALSHLCSSLFSLSLSLCLCFYGISCRMYSCTLCLDGLDESGFLAEMCAIFDILLATGSDVYISRCFHQSAKINYMLIFRMIATAAIFEHSIDWRFIWRFHQLITTHFSIFLGSCHGFIKYGI